ncbi:uncharacterized protein LOC124279684 [Haliotis rubra]|uniref:uncharacterized protein LOC124279684 n=1 Tax=Haliotis rubra TaxID=36100 RepID=UPI001EE50087|nr:uncharacterized protein LOC124279684 [Haliotis rubra]
MGPTSRMGLTCLHHGIQHGGLTTQGMEVGKTVDNRRIQMATLRRGDTSPHIVDDSIRKRASSSGIITDRGGYMYISLYQLRCDDQGMYYCKSNFTNNTTIVLYHNVTVTATAHIPYMRVTPSGSRHSVGLDLHIRCSGRVGSQFNSSLWRWEWRSAGESRSWTEYPHKERISYERPTEDPVSKCELQAASTLTHTITDLDDCRRIRCSVGDVKYSDEVTIRLDSPDGEPSLHGDKSTLLVYCVSVFLLLATALCLTATMYLTWRRRRARRQDAVEPRRSRSQETGGLQFISFPSVDADMYGDSLKPPLPDSNI